MLRGLNTSRTQKGRPNIERSIMIDDIQICIQLCGMNIHSWSNSRTRTLANKNNMLGCSYAGRGKVPWKLIQGEIKQKKNQSKYYARNSTDSKVRKSFLQGISFAKFCKLDRLSRSLSLYLMCCFHVATTSRCSKILIICLAVKTVIKFLVS